MLKILFGLAVVALLAVGGFFVLNNYIYQEKQGPTDYKEATYMISGEPMRLGEGGVEYFGNVAKGDLNGDGIVDLAFLITQETGGLPGQGTGTFFYLVGAIQTPSNTYNGTHAVFIGDRIAPQTTEYRSFSGIPGGYIIVNYADRLPGEPMTAQPSVGKSLWLKLDPSTMQFGEIVQDFEGEADPSRMTLGMKTWEWASALYNDGRQVYPKKAGVFSLTFGNEGRFTATTDCNSVAGEYAAKDGLISFTSMMSTLKYCEGSQEGEFTQLLGNASGYHFTSRGELILDLKFDSLPAQVGGSVVFR